MHKGRLFVWINVRLIFLQNLRVVSIMSAYKEEYKTVFLCMKAL